jgi:DNA topoisomerase-1
VYTLVVCEKPDAARRIAKALGGAKETRISGVPVFDVRFQDKSYKVCSAVGHLYGLVDRTKSRSVYPVFDLEWAPVEGKSRVINVISRLSREADGFVHACDYDQEGEVIGHSILQYACNGAYEKSKRAKFSTLTDDEIRESFAGLQKPGAGLAAAGRSRHLLDFIYGVNLSRALAQSFKAGNRGYRNLSIGRVQGPTLAFAADREQEIRLFVPDPYWVMTADFEKDGQMIRARYEKPKVDTLAQARAITNTCTGKSGVVSSVDKKKIPLRPPTPFNTGDLQREAFRLFRVSPGYTLAIAEKLYLRALISYPRTSSQKLPPAINYRKILSGLARSSLYGPASVLLSRNKLAPHEGPMSDPAHPAIYPTGVCGKLSGLEFKIYDLIVKRFLATFGDAAVAERTDVVIDINGHLFVAEGNVVTYEGWTAFYRPYARIEETTLPQLAAGDVLLNKQVAMEEKLTQPPPRYSQSSLLAKMEQEEIGTKATRADIIATLLKRSYLEQKRSGIEVTDLGFAVVESMREHVPDIISTELTRSMEEQLERVEQGAAEPVAVIEYAVNRLVASLEAFRNGAHEIGLEIGAASKPDNVLGSCPVCKTGSLRTIRSKKTRKRFVGCSNYANGCRASAPLPQKGIIKVAKTCRCDWPIVKVVFARRAKPWQICVNAQCPYK